jgi:hypothetical protein
MKPAPLPSRILVEQPVLFSPSSLSRLLARARERETIPAERNSVVDLLGEILLLADGLYEIELGLEPVNVLFLDFVWVTHRRLFGGPGSRARSSVG